MEGPGRKEAVRAGTELDWLFKSVVLQQRVRLGDFKAGLGSRL